MDAAGAKREGESWASSNAFTLTHTDESERRLSFAAGDVTFFVVYPEPSSTKWHVWSDREDLLPYLMADLQDFLEADRQKTLSDVLDKASKCLTPVLGAAANNAAGVDADDDDNGDDDDLDDDDDDIDDGYYENVDLDAENDEQTKLPESDEEMPVAAQALGTKVHSTAVNRLIKDWKAFAKSNGQYGVTGGPRDDNMFLWNVQLTNIPEDTRLGKDLRDYAKRYNTEPVVSMEMKFPSDYPMVPPFVRVIRPRFKFLTGHVTIGGSVCMELLTRSGWRPTNDIESILVQIRCEIMTDENTSLATHQADKPYDETEAKQAFDRMVQRYGWN